MPIGDFCPYSRETQVGKKSSRKPTPAQKKAVYDKVTEDARDPQTGYLICALCGKPGKDDDMDRDHIQGGTARKTTEENVRIVHHTCHMKSHQTGKRERHKKNALTSP